MTKQSAASGPPSTDGISVGYVSDDPTATEIPEALEGANDRLTVESISDDTALEGVRTNRIECLVGRTTADDAHRYPLLDRVREEDSRLPVFLVTDDWDEAAASAALEAGATGCLAESSAVQGSRLATRIERAVERVTRGNEREATLERITGAFVSIDADWEYTYVNEQASDLLERPGDALIGASVRSVFPDIVDSEIEHQLDLALEEQLPVTFTEYFTPLERWLEIRAFPSEDGLSIFFTDVTDRIRAEAELEANVATLQTLYDISTRTDASLGEKLPALLDLGCDYLELPYGFLTRINLDERTQTVVESRSDHPLLQTGESCPLAEAYCRKTIKTHELVTVANAPDEGWTGDPAYELFELGSYVGAKVTVDGAIWGTLCFASRDPRDGSGFSEAERSLVKLMAKWVSYETEREQSRETLERQNDRLQAFTSVVSHDLRNPLNVAQGSLALAREGDRSQLAECEAALERMEQLIDELLSLAEQGATTADLEPVSVRDCATKAWSMVDTDEAALDLEAAPWIRADPDRLQQLLENLFRNALDHGVPEGETSAELTVSVGPCENGFYVADTGAGIPDDVRETIFDIGVTTDEDGTGFGLGIVKRVADAHDWDLEATASEAGGARFELTGVARPRDER
ncbi:sensor histidine kinase [Natrinema longum]|uniref:histidine kinase n=1 Tax=Natrinema longum TaxID=370324 RepID=A0A8A2U4V3_9EURY|nr:ATP-binding protein [Natrinema longum]MBZ6494904.1 PAS domain-containing protein [Natrinema longum]QSW83797.1 PAS domain-containing protein [Natrinema longum]